MSSTKAADSKTSAEELIHHILEKEYGRKVLEVSFQPRSNNSKVYTLSVGPANSENVGDGTHSGRPGVDDLPLGATKLVMRFTNPEANLNDAVRVQSEVASMALARDALASLDAPLVPRVYGWNAAADEAGWVLMEFMSGAPFETGVFKKMNKKSKKIILEQVARVFKLIQQYELPASVNGYGGLGFAEDGSIVVGPTPIYGASGACETYHELYSQYLKTQLKFMDQCDIVKGWKDTDLRARIDEFVATGFKPLLERASGPAPRRTLVHGDFDLHNLLFDPTTNRITALLDFDFSHVASELDEYFYSFDSIDGLLVAPEAGGSKELLRPYMLHGFGARKSTDLGDFEVAMLRDQEFILAGVKQPVDMMPGAEPLSELYWFIQNISPGLFFLPRVRAKTSPQKLNVMKRHIQEHLERTLLRWGF